MPFLLSSWENYNTIITNNFAFVIGVLFLLNITFFISLLYNARSRKQLWKRYQELMAGYEKKSLEQLLLDYRQKTDSFAAKILWLEQLERELERKLSLTVQHVGLIRYNAFNEMGSDLSFSVALLDADASGVVITSIYGRDESRTFAKPIVKGNSSYRLTEEEQKAVQEAMVS